MPRLRTVTKGTVGVSQAVAVVIACTAIAATMLCAGGGHEEPALEVEDDVVFLQTQTKQWTSRRGDSDGENLDDAARMMEQDTQVLHSLMGNRDSVPREAAREPASRAPIEPLASALPITPASPLALVAQTENAELRKQLQEVAHQRDKALGEAEQAAESLSFVKGELQLALTQSQDAVVAAESAPPAPAPAPAPTAAPAPADDGDDCAPDIITFHCKVSMPIGIVIWVAFLLLICGCCCCCGYYSYKAMEPSKPSYPAPSARGGARPEGRY